MPKRSKQQIAQDEIKILNELQKNANASIDAIARRCKFSRQKVWRSIKRLEAGHVIWGYTAIVDDAKQDRKHFVVLIKKTNRPLNEAVVNSAASPKLQELVSMENVIIENSFYVHGINDWIIMFTAPDMKHAKRFCEILNTTYEGYIKELNLEETLFWVRRQHIFNPDAKKLKHIVF
jgi:DNA-binding Lrp family transcriptional regulator